MYWFYTVAHLLQEKIESGAGKCHDLRNARQNGGVLEILLFLWNFDVWRKTSSPWMFSRGFIPNYFAEILWRGVQLTPSRTKNIDAEILANFFQFLYIFWCLF